MARVDNTGGSGFTVDNGTGLVVRTKLNQIIAALSTTNQGSGDPSIGVAAYTQHIDGNTLKIRNAANNAFVSLGDVVKQTLVMRHYLQQIHLQQEQLSI